MPVLDSISSNHSSGSMSMEEQKEYEDIIQPEKSLDKTAVQMLNSDLMQQVETQKQMIFKLQLLLSKESTPVPQKSKSRLSSDQQLQDLVHQSIYPRPTVSS